MYNVEVNQTFHRIAKILYLFGIWRTEEESKFGKIGRKFFFIFYYLLFQIFLVTCAVLSESSNETLCLASVEILLSVVTTKLMYLLWKKKEIYEFLIDPITKPSTTTADTFYRFSNDIQIFMKFVHSYLLMLGISFIFYMISTLPMFTDGRKLPFFISFTLVGRYSDIIYLAAYAFVLSGILLGFTCTLINIFIWYTMFNYSWVYQVLGIQMSNLGRKKIATSIRWQTDVKPSQSTDFHQDLIRVIERHRKMFRTIVRFKSCFSTLFTAQIATSGIAICISAYVLAYSSNENLLQMPIFMAILIYGIFDIFLVMYLANDISVASGKLSYCLFESEWIGQPKSCLKSLLIVGETVRLSQQLVILKVYPMNLETFTVIMKGAYSLFNILQSFS